ncbi:MAG TPA: PP2C family protein-serine/threonine phosphatase, partial [Phycisphaerae bacterium]
SSDYRFIISSMQEAPAKIAKHEPSAAILLSPPAYFNGHQKELIRVLDELVERQIGAIVLAYNAGDLELAHRMCATDGLMAVPLSCNPDELLGRLAGLAAARPIIDQLQRENSMLRKFDTGMSTQITQIDEEMRLAARLQVDFLPRKMPDVEGVSFDVFFRPASYVSGDIYDVNRLDEDHIGFFVADAVGHGMPAALLTIFLKRTLLTKEVTKDGYRLIPPDEALAHLNNELVQQQLSLCQFVTMAYGILNTKTMQLQWARAGHPAPMLLKTSGSAEELDLDGALLGVFADEEFPLQIVQLEPGDSVLMYSDGFESAFSDPSGLVNERYRLEFSKLAGENPHARFQHMVEELDRQEGSLHQRDDLTALLMTIAQRK